MASTRDGGGRFEHGGAFDFLQSSDRLEEVQPEEPTASRLSQCFVSVSPVLALLAALVGVLVMLGWFFDVAVLKAIIPELSPMKFNAAVTVTVAGIGLWLATRPGPHTGRALTLARICAAIALSVGLLTFVEIVFDIDLGIDQLFIRDLDAIPGLMPGRMAWTSAVNLAVLGIVLYLLTCGPDRYATAINIGGLLIILIAAFMVLSYLYNVEALYRKRLTSARMAAPAVVAFVLLGIALVNARPGYRFRRILADPGQAGITSRRLVPVAVLMPLVGGLALSLVYGTGRTNINFAVPLFAAAMMAGFTTVVLWSAEQIRTAEAARRQAEHKVRTASLYTRSLIEASLDPLVTINENGKITDVNRATEEVTGVTRAELVGTDFADYFVEREAARAGYKKVLEQGEVRDYSLTIRRPDGTTDDVLYNATIYRNENGEPQGIFAAARIVTELKRAEGARAQLAAIVESSGDGIIGAGMDGAIASWNGGAEKIYGFSADEVLGHHASMLAPPEQARDFESLLARAREGEIVTNHRAARRRKNGTIVHVEVTLSPVRGKDQTVTGVSVVVRDVTERVHSEQELQRYRSHLEEEVHARTARLEAAYHELETFSYSISHDLRIPLRAIDGFSRILLEDYRDKVDDEGKRVLNVIRTNSQRMGRLIDDILDFIRLGRVEFKMVRVDMSSLAKSVLQDLQPHMAGREIKVNLSALPAACGDTALLRQVFANLLSNAIKFTRPRRQALIDISARTADAEHIYCVKDNGVGFDMQYSSKLFGVFHRLHGIDEFEGNGTGLAMVKRIVVRHGGRVWAEGEVGKGAAFYFALPVNEDMVRRAATAGLSGIMTEP